MYCLLKAPCYVRCNWGSCSKWRWFEYGCSNQKPEKLAGIFTTLPCYLLDIWCSLAYFPLNLTRCCNLAVVHYGIHKVAELLQHHWNSKYFIWRDLLLKKPQSFLVKKAKPRRVCPAPMDQRKKKLKRQFHLICCPPGVHDLLPWSNMVKHQPHLQLRFCQSCSRKNYPSPD